MREETKAQETGRTKARPIICYFTAHEMNRHPCVYRWDVRAWHTITDAKNHVHSTNARGGALYVPIEIIEKYVSIGKGDILAVINDRIYSYSHEMGYTGRVSYITKEELSYSESYIVGLVDVEQTL